MIINGVEKQAYLITGDLHRKFDRVATLCTKFKTTAEDVLIVLGDAGINFSDAEHDKELKKALAQWPITLFCVHGNHEKRPASVEGYELHDWHGGKVFTEPDYPNLLFAKDGEIYDIDGKQTLVLGGAYSIDKWWRLQNHYPWFPDEQPDDEIKAYVNRKLKECGNKVDVVLSHTVPYDSRPVELFTMQLPPEMNDVSTEQWLQEIENKLTFSRWYAGHFHCDITKGRIDIMYCKLKEFCGDDEALIVQT